MKKKRWEFKPPPLPTPPILFLFRMPKHYSLFKNIRKYSFFKIAFQRCNLQNRNSCDYLVFLSMWKGHGTLYCLLPAQLLLLIHDLICSVADGRRQVGRFCPRALSHAIAKRSWLTNLITRHDSPLQHGSSPPTLLLITVLSTVSVDG